MHKASTPLSPKMLYTSERLASLAAESFLGSGSKFYASYVNAVTAWECGTTRSKVKVPPLRRVLDIYREELDILESEEDPAALDALVAKLEKDKPTAEEVELWCRFKAGAFSRPKKRSGRSNWELAQVLNDNPYKLAMLEAVRIVKAFPSIKKKVEETLEKLGTSDIDYEQRGWVDPTAGWSARRDDLESCEEPDDFCPEEEVRTWLVQIETMTLLEKLELSPLDEYS